jgi:hypothetical protein
MKMLKKMKRETRHERRRERFSGSTSVSGRGVRGPSRFLARPNHAGGQNPGGPGQNQCAGAQPARHQKALCHCVHSRVIRRLGVVGEGPGGHIAALARKKRQAESATGSKCRCQLNHSTGEGCERQPVPNRENSRGNASYPSATSLSPAVSFNASAHVVSRAASVITNYANSPANRAESCGRAFMRSRSEKLRFPLFVLPSTNLNRRRMLKTEADIVSFCLQKTWFKKSGRVAPMK